MAKKLRAAMRVVRRRITSCLCCGAQVAQVGSQTIAFSNLSGLAGIRVAHMTMHVFTRQFVLMAPGQRQASRME